jgi:PAS domain S-box-containing protein
VAAHDLARDERFRDSVLLEHGIRSGLAVPLVAGERTFGVLLALGDEVHEFTDEDTLFAENIGHVVTTAIARREAEEALGRERDFSAGLLQTVGALVLVLDAEGTIVRINRACEEVTGFELDEVRGRSISSVFPLRAEADLFRVIFDKLKTGASLVEYESLLTTKHGGRRRIAWAYSALRSAGGPVQRVIATGIDVTEQREAEEQLRTARAASQRVDDDASSGGAEPERAPASSAPAAAGPSVEAVLEGALEEATSPLNVERRRHARRSYPYRQPIAYVLDGRLPDPDDFRSVPCNDIAANGFSFLSPTPPQSDALVVALGTPPRVTYLAAQIVHATRIEHHGRNVFLIGCNYTNRVRY